jgi:hypothetical protein
MARIRSSLSPSEEGTGPNNASEQEAMFQQKTYGIF